MASSAKALAACGMANMQLFMPRALSGVVARPCPVLLAPNVVERRSTASLRRVVAHTALLERPDVAETSFASLMDDEDEEYEEHDVVQVDANQEVDESLKVENLGLSSQTVNALLARGISALFPIQKSVFQPAMDGRDLIGRAKTGSGKTLAFALPVVENLLKENTASKPKRGRSPRCIVLAPTRELANQVAREFESVATSMSVLSVYGGTSIGAQIRDLERGADVVVGTPGRVIDLIERGCLKLDQVRYAILDEADQMLDMGFEEDMEKILKYAPKERQTLLFSATLPKWVNKVARRFQTNPLLVDLVGEENTGRLADTIKLLLMQVEQSQKVNATLDAINLYAGGGKAIIFVNTKAKADEICETVNQSIPCVALHGDISQAQRERSLALFREGKFPILVATDVAARGLDIPSVELVVHYDVPQDNEAFLHRSGRTGRAGQKGNAILLYTDREVRYVGQVLKACKVEQAELIGSPDPADVMTQASRNVLGVLDKVEANVIDFFVPAAERVLASDQPARVLAAALASMSGFRKVPQPRSLLNYQDGLVTCRLTGPPGAVDGWNSLTKTLKSIMKKTQYKDMEFEIGKMKILENQPEGQDGVAFDLPVAQAQVVLEAAPAAQKLGFNLDRPKSIAVDVNEMLVGRGGGAPRADRGSSRWGSSDRYGSSRGGSSYGRDRGERGGSYGGERGGYGERRSSGGGYDRLGGGYDRSSGSSWGESSYGGRSGRSSGGRESYGSRGGAEGAGYSGGGAGYESRSAPRQARNVANFEDGWADEDYFVNTGGYQSTTTGKGSSRSSSDAKSTPKFKDGWAQW